MTIINDRRDNPESFSWYVTAKDKFMSGWGMASGGASWCAWACTDRAQAERCLARIRSRDGMRYVSLRLGIEGWRPRAAHLSIYVSDD